jgi:hypothetical protein
MKKYEYVSGPDGVPWRPAADDALTMYPVASLVNSGRVDDPKCVEPWKGSAKPREVGLWEE